MTTRLRSNLKKYTYLLLNYINQHLYYIFFIMFIKLFKIFAYSSKHSIFSISLVAINYNILNIKYQIS